MTKRRLDEINEALTVIKQALVFGEIEERSDTWSDWHVASSILLTAQPSANNWRYRARPAGPRKFTIIPVTGGFKVEEGDTRDSWAGAILVEEQLDGSPVTESETEEV